MKNLLFKLLKITLGLIGVTIVDSCVFRVEYGCPHADFQVKGVVSDENDNGIQGIRVVIKGEYPNSYYSGAVPKTDTLWTDRNGTYMLTDGQDIGGYAYLSSVKLEFEDVDGAENGGEFQKVEIEVPVFKVKEGDGSWYDGAYEAGADVTMIKK